MACSSTDCNAGDYVGMKWMSEASKEVVVGDKYFVSRMSEVQDIGIVQLMGSDNAHVFVRKSGISPCLMRVSDTFVYPKSLGEVEPIRCEGCSCTTHASDLVKI